MTEGGSNSAAGVREGDTLRLILRGLAISMLAAIISVGCSGSSAGTGHGNGDAGSDATSSGSSGSSGGGNGNEAGSDATSSQSSDGSSEGGRSESGGGDAHMGGVVFNDAGIPICGSTPCDLKSNTCCVSYGLGSGTCVAHATACPSGSASFGCLGAADCPARQVCCGAGDTTAMVAQTACQMLGTNGLCSGMNTSTSGFAQMCRSNTECGGGLKCIAQSCAVSTIHPPAQLSMCGLQSAAPFNCTAN